MPSMAHTPSATRTLLAAAEHGRTEELLALIDGGSVLDVVDPVGHSAACFAAEAGHVSVLRALRDHGAPIFRCDAFGAGTPLAHVRAFDHPAVVAFYLEQGADRIGATTLEALMRGAAEPERGRLAVLMERLEARPGAPPFPLAEELLLAATATERLDILRWLADRGLDLDRPIEMAGAPPTALAHAAARLRVASVRFLLGRGASVERALGGRDVIAAVGWEDQQMDARDRILGMLRDAPGGARPRG